MLGIRVETERLARHASDVRSAGEALAVIERELRGGRSGSELFVACGEGVAASYDRLAAALCDRVSATAAAVAEAGDELRAVVDRHTARDDEHADELVRGEVSR